MTARRSSGSASRVGNPDRVVHGRCDDLTPLQWPPFSLLFTSPPYATVAVEVSQLRQGNHTRPLVWQLGATLNEIFTLREDLVRVNTGGTEADPGYDHTHILVFDVPPAAP
jgi:hypothetical protein